MTVRWLNAFADLVAAEPNATVLIDGRSGNGQATEVSRGELSDRAASMAFDLRAAGVGTGDCVAVWLPNWSAAIAVQIAALAVGAHVIGINTRYNVDEIAHVLRVARPVALVLADGFLGQDPRPKLTAALDQAGVAAPGVLVVTAPGSPAPTGIARLDVGAGAALFPTGLGRLELTPTAQPGLATAFTTSGSTGPSKLAAHTEAGVTGHTLAVAERIGLGPAHTVLGALPVAGVFGFVGVYAGVLTGARVLLEPVFDADAVLDDMVEFHVTHVAAADDLVGRIADAWQSRRPRLSLSWIGIADFEGRSRALAEWAEAEFGATVTGVYGSSELFALALFWPRDVAADRRWSAGGRVVCEAIEVRVVDPVTRQQVADDEEGELQFRGPNVVDAYLGRPDLGENVDGEGWFNSGDLGRAVDGGFEYVCRIGDALRLRGFLVDPGEIELRLLKHPAVALAKVVGIPGQDGGTVAVAFVVGVAAGAPEPVELKQWCASTLAAFKVPADVHVIETMPTTSGTNGTKIRTATLRQLAMDLRDR